MHFPLNIQEGVHVPLLCFAIGTQQGNEQTATSDHCTTFKENQSGGLEWKEAEIVHIGFCPTRLHVGEDPLYINNTVE